MIKRFYLFVLRRFNYYRYLHVIGIKFGKECRISRAVSFDTEPYLITIGDHVHISGGVVFNTHEGAHWVLKGLDKNKFEKVFAYGRITIGNNVFVGLGSTILHGVEIEDNVIIGANTLVNKSLPRGGVYAGVPVKYICSVEEFSKKFMSQMPEYDYDAYKRNKRDAVLKIVDSFPKAKWVKTDK